MTRYQITTLIDITRSNADRSENNPLKKGQQANFNSLIQSIGMRSNVDWDTDPKFHTGKVLNQNFKANHWTWEFICERDQVFFKDDNDPVGLLLDDLNNVPIISNLKNNVDIFPAAFKTRGDNINTWITIIS